MKTEITITRDDVAALAAANIWLRPFCLYETNRCLILLGGRPYTPKKQGQVSGYATVREVRTALRRAVS